MAAVTRSNAAPGVVYDNGPPNLLNGFEMTHWTEANPFTLNGGIIVGKVTFWDLEASASFASIIYWEIRAGGTETFPGEIIFSGSSVNLTHVATGRRAFGYPEYINGFDLPSIALPAGSYWLVLHNGPLSNNAGRDIFWETTTSINLQESAADAAPFANDWDSNGSPSQMAFQVTGVLESLRPRITSIARPSGIPRITFTTVSGQHYRVEYSNSLVQPAWTTITGAGDVPGTGGEVQISDLDPGVASMKQRFYRLVLL